MHLKLWWPHHTIHSLYSSISHITGRFFTVWATREALLLPNGILFLINYLTIYFMVHESKKEDYFHISKKIFMNWQHYMPLQITGLWTKVQLIGGKRVQMAVYKKQFHRTKFSTIILTESTFSWIERDTLLFSGKIKS